MVDGSAPRSPALGSVEPAPDRYVAALRARRGELRAQLDLLAGGQHAAWRSCLALSRLDTAAALDRALTELARRAGAHVDAGPTARRRLPTELTAALHGVAAEAHAGWAARLGPALRRIAAHRRLVVPDGWPRLPAPGPAPVVTAPPPSGRRSGTLLAGALDGVAAWRLALLPAVLLGLVGVPLLGGPAAVGVPGSPPVSLPVPLPVAAVLLGGVAAVAVVIGIRARRDAADRAGWHRHLHAELTAARAALDTDLARRLLELDRTALGELDAAVRRRRAVLDAELRGLTGQVRHD